MTRYTKIYNKLRVTIDRIDATLGTSFGAELADLVAKEKAEFAAIQAAQTGAPAAGETTYQPQPQVAAASPEPSAPAMPREPLAANVSFDTSKLLGWNKLSAEHKARISGVTADKILFANPSETLLACPKCKVPAPSDFITCPACGQDFV